METITAPFTKEEVAALNQFQSMGGFHPFTCPTSSTTLTATEDGWVCSCCVYTQGWAHQFMVEYAQ